MIEPRHYAAGIKLQNGSWWVTGGFKYINKAPSPSLISTEVLSLSINNDLGLLTFLPGQNLPIGMQSHCICRLNETHIFLGSGNTNNAYLYNEISNHFTDLPKLQIPRLRPACAAVRYNNSNKIIDPAIMVLGGYSLFDQRSSYTIEYIDPSNLTDVWHLGDELSTPNGWSDGGYISYPNVSSLTLISGLDRNKKLLNHVYMFNETNQQFDMKIGISQREGVSVALIPDGELSCDNKTDIML